MPIPSFEKQHEIVKRIKFQLEKEDTVYQLINDNKIFVNHPYSQARHFNETY